MKNSWQSVKLRDVCEFEKCQGNYSNLTYVGLENIESNTARFVGTLEPQTVKSTTFKFSNLHVLYGRLRPYLNKVLAPDFNGQCSTEIFPIKPGPKLIRKYLLYWFLSKDTVDKINATSTGTRMPRADMNEVMDFDFPLPLLPEQQRIVAVLDEAIAAIAVARANAEKNLQNARELFEIYSKDIFIKRGEGWVERKIGEVCKLKSGTTVNPTLEKAVGDLPYLKVADMTFTGNEGAIISSSRFLNKADISENSIFPPGTTIFPKRGGAILTNKKRITSVSICADLNIMGVIPSNILKPEFLYYYFMNVDMRNLGSGSSIPQINNYDIEPLLISYPVSTHQQEIIVNNFKELLTETQHLEAIYRKIQTDLKELEKSLLHQAFTGQL